MRFLLDTNALLWTMLAQPRLSAVALEIIGDEANDVFVSVVSAWEIEIKLGKGKLDAPSDLETALAAQRFEPLAVTMRHVHAVETLPRHHRDPFDRMLIAQAQLEGLTIITSDQKMSGYPVATLPAT